MKKELKQIIRDEIIKLSNNEYKNHDIKPADIKQITDKIYNQKLYISNLKEAINNEVFYYIHYY